MESTNTSNSCPAKSINDENRKIIALQVLKNKQTITDVAQENKVSRKFVHSLKNKAIDGVDQSFKPKIKKEEKVLFYLPVTTLWLFQLIICLLLHCRSSFRGIIKVLDDAFDYPISIGTVHNISQQAKEKAKEINAQQDLRCVTLGAHDEIFHYNKPILAGVDIPSLYCYLLSQEQHRDEETWAIHLWDLEKQGFNPERIFADHAEGLRAGHQTALPHIPCDADHFHIIKKLTDMRRFFQNRLKSSISYQKEIEEKMKKAKLIGKPQKYSKKLSLSRKHKEQIQYLSESINTLVSWLEHDVLHKAGPNPTDRYALYDFILDEFEKLSGIHPHRIHDVCIALKNRRHLLLSFSEVLEDKFKLIAQEFGCTTEIIWKICQLQRYHYDGDQYAVKHVPFLLSFGEQFYDIEDSVISALNSIERTSSMIENLNSRLRPYLFLRREIGYDYLELLRFYLNHTPFLRSENNRAKKTPTELLTNQPHAHWLEMLGFKRFKRAA